LAASGSIRNQRIDEGLVRATAVIVINVILNLFQDRSRRTPRARRQARRLRPNLAERPRFHAGLRAGGEMGPETSSGWRVGEGRDRSRRFCEPHHYPL